MGRGRAPCCDKSKVKRGPWSPAEDLRLINFIRNNGHTNWRALPKQAGLLRCGKSCRLRWINYLRPDVKRGNFTPHEEQTIINLHNSIGNKWSKIASCLPGRTDNEIKNVWNTHLKKRLLITKETAKDCQKTEANDSQTDDCSISPSSCTSSSVTISRDQAIENARHDQTFHESEVKKPDDQSLKLTSINPVDGELTETASYDAFASNFISTSGTDNASGTNKPSGISRPETTNQVINEIVIPLLESDTDFWELMDSLDPNQSTESEQNDKIQDSNITNPEEINPDSEVECKKWLRLLENELGLTSDNDNLPNMQEIDFDQPEISPHQLDCSPIWSENLGI